MSVRVLFQDTYSGFRSNDGADRPSFFPLWFFPSIYQIKGPMSHLSDEIELLAGENGSPRFYLSETGRRADHAI